MRRRIHFGAIFLAVWLASSQAALHGYSSQQSTDDGQYHLQTDGDGDRYFVYQTNNGQYRKERRLKDGSVVGTTGWVDAAGYLRLQDYIADDQGYRIYKSKTVYVGPERSITDSLKIAKSAPADAGFGYTPASRRPGSFSNSGAPSDFPSEVSVTPPSFHRASTPVVHVSPNSIDSSSKKPRFDFRPITASEAASTIVPSPFYEPPSGDSNDLGNGGSSTTPNPFNHWRQSGEWRRRVGTSRVRYTPPNLGDGYTPQFPTYDGNTLTTRGGFRYYLPKNYHEEQGDGEEKTGSFGYVDPFGIRRVIYYNADPSGFKVRKNNRFVGHDATPYDPRPLQR